MDVLGLSLTNWWAYLPVIYRYSDFHVNEIRPDGTIVRLTTTSPPVEGQ